MPASPQLDLLETELAEFSGHLNDTADVVDDVSDVLGYTRKILSVPQKIHKAADKLHDIAEAGGTMAKVFAKIGILKPIALPFKTVLFSVSDAVEKIEIKAKALEIQFKPYVEALKKAETKLDKLKYGLEVESVAIDRLSDRVGDVNETLDDAQTFAKSDIPNATLKNTINAVFPVVDTAARTANTALVPINDTMTDIETATAELKALLDLPDFQDLIEFSEGLSEIEDALEFLQEPLSAIMDAAGPVLDALGSIFGFILKPLEFVLEAVLEATGIQGLIDKAADAVVSLLPDVGILDDIGKALTDALETKFSDILDTKITNPIDNILETLTVGPFLPSLLGGPTSGDDVLLGDPKETIGRTVDAGAGDDFIMGGAYDDTLDGGAGTDVLIGGRGDDTLIGGDGPGRDVVVYSGYIADYAIVSVLDSAGDPTGVWKITDYSSDGGRSAGRDTLIGVEDITFADGTVPIGDIAGFLRTRSGPGDYAYISSTYSNVYELDGTRLFSSNGIDWMFGGTGWDVMLGGRGNDQISSVRNDLETEDTQKRLGDDLFGEEDNDTFLVDTYSAFWDNIFGGTGEDRVSYAEVYSGVKVFLGDAYSSEDQLYQLTSSSFDVEYLGGRINPRDASMRVGVIREVEHITGSDHDDHFWGSAKANTIDGGDGNDQIRGLGGDDVLFGGEGDDVLNGDRGDDVLHGGGGSNQFIGSLGDDTFYGSDTGGFQKAIYGLAPTIDLRFVRIGLDDFETTGHTGENLDLPGYVLVYNSKTPGKNYVTKYQADGTYIGQDEVFGMDVIVGTEGDDLIYSANGHSQKIYGGGGDDHLIGGSGDPTRTTYSSGSTFYAGEGDDILETSNAAEIMMGEAGNDTLSVLGSNGLGGDNIFGDDNRSAPLEGIDTVDFSRSDFSWHVVLNTYSGHGDAYGKFPLSAVQVYDPDYLQRVPDPNLPTPGGKGRIGEFEVFKGSEYRDVFYVGSPDSAITVYGNGGDDVIFGGQVKGDILYGGDGNDILGTRARGNGGVYDADVVTQLFGENGYDKFIAGVVRETFSGGSGIDGLSYEYSDGGVTANLRTGEASGGDGRGDTFSGIENLTGSAAGDSLTGDDGANVLIGWDGDDTLDGGDGSDVLYGNDGDDTLLGGDGNDTLHGGLGADVMKGGAGIDTASYKLFQLHPKGGAEQLIELGTGVDANLATGKAGEDTLEGIENLTGSHWDDTLTGDDGGNALVGGDGDDILRGGGGDDVLLGGEGDDDLNGDGGDDWFAGGAGRNRIDGGAGRDILDYSILSYGITVHMAGVRSRKGETTGKTESSVGLDWAVWTDSLTEIDDPLGRPGDKIQTGTTEARYTYQVLDRGTDDPSDDLYRKEDPITPDRLFRLEPVFARSHDDVAEVRYLPDDLLREQEFSVITRYEAATDVFDGIEIIAGSTGNDTIFGNGEATEFYGNGGNDRISGGGGGDTLNGGAGKDRLLGQGGGDTLLGGGGNDRLSGGGGDDILSGGAGKDVLRGQSGSDTLLGGGGKDRLSGSGGSDVLKGGGGNDVLEGGGGDDVLIGQKGDDRFVFAKGGGADKVRDFRDDADTLEINGLGTLDEILALGTEVKGDVVFDFGGGDVLTVLKVTLDQLSGDILV
ncbi:calcium-binding protein [Antarcticimicrobium luteum]|nr:hypothetical protein [Antarcticimicrobium luteum]